MKSTDAMKWGPVGIELAILGLKGTNEVVRSLRRERRDGRKPDLLFLRALQKRAALLRRNVEKLGTDIDRLLETAGGDYRGQSKR